MLAVVGGTPGLAGAAVSRGPSHPVQAELIPLYDNADPANWTAVCSQTTGAGDGSWIIADPFQGQGAGTAPVPAWTKVIKNCYKYGRASVIGYVWTNYGQVSIADVEAQVKNWYSFYKGNIAGIFFDGVSDTVPGTTTSNQTFYRTLANYVHTHEGNNDEVVFNFGANPGSPWMFTSSNANNADIVVTFEGSYNDPGLNPYTAWTPAAWEASYPANDFSAMIYDAPGDDTAPQPGSACGSLATQNIGYVYVGTWYDQLPPYFSTFAADAAAGTC
jgi:hypothetical protein